jgi:RecA/RadA recombinase
MAKKEKEQRDLTELFVSQVNLHRPKTNQGGMFEFAMSDEEIFGDVKYVLLTGIDSFDTFTGGFPFGRMSEVFGLENCGKSALMIRSMCRFQAMHIYEVTNKDGFIYSVRRVDPKNIRLIRAYVDNEGSLEKGFKLGVHDVRFNEQGEEFVEEIMLDKTGVGLTDTIEQVFMSYDKFLKVMDQAEREAIEDETDQVVFGIFVVDTIAGTSSKDEMQRAWGERDFPRAAQQISEGFRRLRGETVRHNVAAIFTNQVRKSFGQTQGSGYKVKFNTPQADDYSTFGGKALSFYATHRIFMFQVPIKYTLVKGAQFPAGFLVGFRTIKNRLRKPQREARMVLLFDEKVGGLHNQLSLLESLCFLKAAELRKDGSIFFRFRQMRIETTTFEHNVKLDEEPTRSRKKAPDPEIDGRYQWIAYYKAHRPDFDKLWEAAVVRANSTPGLDAFYEPDVEDEEVSEDEDPDPRPRRANSRSSGFRTPTFADKDLND